MTVKDLLKHCEYQINKGNGNKEIYVSNDDEGNGYHKLIFTFSENVSELDEYGQVDKKNGIILG